MLGCSIRSRLLRASGTPPIWRTDDFSQRASKPGCCVGLGTPRDFGMSVLEKEPQELARRIRSLRVGVGAHRVAAGPGVSCAVHRPGFREQALVRIGRFVDRHRA